MSELASVTAAPGTTAPAGSRTVPCKALETVCPDRQAAKSATIHKSNAIFLVVIVSL
jgi:hypothetical protein